MVEDNQAETRGKIHQRLSTETDPEVKKYSRKAFKLVLVFCILIAIIVAGAGAIWDNVGLSMLLGGLSFSTMGALILALGAMPKEKTILDMGSTYYDGNKYLVAELRKNRVLAQWGIYLILIGSFLLYAELAIRVSAQISV